MTDDPRILAAGGLLGGAVLFGVSTLGSKVVLYGSTGDGSPEFRRVATTAGQLLRTTHVYPVATNADFEQAVLRHARIARFVWAGHGTANGIHAGATAVRGEVGADALAALLAPRLAIGARVSLASCSAGLPGGFASKLRDAIVRRAPWLVLGGEVRSHTTVGHTTRNPNGAAFPFWRYGQGTGVRVAADEHWALTHR